jgi:hypothetical protein
MSSNTYQVVGGTGSNNGITVPISYPYASSGITGQGYAANNFVGSANTGTIDAGSTDFPVSLLLHFDTGFQDSSVNNLTPTLVGSGIGISNTVFEFGNGSASFNVAEVVQAAINYPVVPGGPLDLSEGDFTIEFWVNPTQSGFFALNNILQITSNEGADLSFGISVQSGEPSPITINNVPVDGTYTVPTNTFTAVAFVLHNGVGTVFVNGVAQTPVGTISVANTDTFSIGPFSTASGADNGFIGFMDEVRVTKLALYTANYTPSTVELSPTVEVADNPNAFYNNVQIEIVGVTANAQPYGISTPAGEQVFTVAFPEGTPQNFFDQVTIASACTGSLTFSTSNVAAFIDGPLTLPSSPPTGNLSNWVWFIDPTDASLMFNPAFVTTVTFTNLPSLTLSVTDTTDDTVNLAWVDIANTASAYNVLRNNVFIAQVPNTVFTFEDTGLTANTTYLYEVDGVDGSNNTLYSANANATTEIAPVGQSVQYLAEYNSGPFLTANGDLNVGGNIFTYFEDTLTPCNTFTDVTGITLNPNPIQLTVDGLLPDQIWIPVGQNVRIRMMDTANNLIDDKDNIPGVPYIPGSTGTIFVIDSVFSTDTSNAASANAANWDYKVANGAFALANTLANNLANVVTSVSSLSNNTIVFNSQGATINIGNTINFVNSPFANVSVVANTVNGVDIQVLANAASSGAAANGSVSINGIIIQWAQYAHTVAGEQGPFTDDFPEPFPNACLNVQATTQGGPGAASLVVENKTKSAFTWFTGFGGADSTGQFILAIGF